MPQKSLFIFYVFLGVFQSSIAQSLNSFTDIDSLKSSYSSSGKLSTIDLSSGYLLNTLGFASNQPFLFDPLELLYSGLPFNALQPSKSIRYSSLPHIGFSYSFGSSGFQFAKFQYTQAFSNKWIVNLDYKNHQTNGILRNSAVRNQLVTLKISKQFKRLESLLTANYSVRSFGWNGGIEEDSSVLSFSPELIPVLKSDAISTRKEVLVNWMNYIHLIADSSQKTGLYFNADFHSRNRIYRETGDLSSQYNQIYVDSFETFDQVQMSSQANEIGFFTTRKKWRFTSGINQAFWNYRNGLFYRDTLEVDLRQSLSFKLSNLSVEQKFTMNLLGRGQSWKNEIYVVKKWKNSSLKGAWKIENTWPELFQRHYFSNNIQYQLPMYELQFKNKLDLSYDFQLNKNDIHLKISHVYLKNPYFFTGTTWSNSLMNTVNSLGATISSDFKYKSLTISPNYSFHALPSFWKFFPNHVVKMRLLIERGVLKKRKLTSYFGAEPQVVGGFSPLIIYPSMDVFVMTNNTTQAAFIDLALFAGFELKGFKFFARAENLGYFWNNRMLQLAKGYPIPPMQIQIGITWDFWN
jgi:hypothetical protein